MKHTKKAETGKQEREGVKVTIERGDVLKARGDVLALKYAQKRYGVDAVVAQKFREQGRRLPRPNEGNTSNLVKSVDGIEADHVLVVGTPDLWMFDYPNIRDFGRLALSSHALLDAPVERLLMTIHGAGFGLDPIEALEHELDGMESAVQSGGIPPSLSRVSIVEENAQNFDRMRNCLRAHFPTGMMRRSQMTTDMGRDGIVTDWPTMRGGKCMVTRGTTKKIVDVRATPESRELGRKESVFVAMPFGSSDMDDLYHYGISGGVRRAGFVCERADKLDFTGDVVQLIRRRIENSVLVIAILTGANVNVYLEVGYAWGRDIDCVLCAMEGEELPFDVQGQKCLFYKNIRDLESKLLKTLRGLQKRI